MMNEDPRCYPRVSTYFLFAFTTDLETSCVTRDVFTFWENLGCLASSCLYRGYHNGKPSPAFLFFFYFLGGSFLGQGRGGVFS